MIVHHIARWPIKNNNPLNEVLTMSTTYQINRPEKGLIQYTDQKRYLWMASILLPLLAVSGVAGYFWLTSEWALLAPLVFLYGVVPALDNMFRSEERRVGIASSGRCTSGYIVHNHVLIVHN